MSERCPECEDGEVWDDRNARYTWCKRCGGEGRIDPYYEDEWYEEDEPEICDQSSFLYLYKGKRGALCLVEGVLTRYEGEDWGEASGWDEYPVNLKHLREGVRQRVIEFGKTMPTGTCEDVDWGWFEDDEDEENEGEPDHAES